MGSLKLFSVIAVFVMNCFVQIFCNQLQNDLLNDVISIDKHDPAELVTHNTVGAIKIKKKLLFAKTKINFDVGSIFFI